MSALILDAGALAAVDRDDRAMMARLRASQQHGLELRTNAPRTPSMRPSYCSPSEATGS